MTEPFASIGRGGTRGGGYDDEAVHKAEVVHQMMRWTGLWPTSVLDVGCGTGEVLLALKDRLDAEGRHDVVYEGWDPAPEPIRLARQREGDRVGFVCGDVLASERRADLVLCLDVVEHVPDDMAFLEAIRPHGVHFVFRVSLELSVLSVLRTDRLVEERRRYGYLHQYNRDLALALLRETGFGVISEHYDRVPEDIAALSGRALERARRRFFRVAPDTAVRWLGGYSLVVCARAEG